MDRIYDEIVKAHFQTNDEMLFLAGPRQVGKTTVAEHAQHLSDALPLPQLGCG